MRMPLSLIREVFYDECSLSLENIQLECSLLEEALKEIVLLAGGSFTRPSGLFRTTGVCWIPTSSTWRSSPDRSKWTTKSNIIFFPRFLNLRTCSGFQTTCSNTFHSTRGSLKVSPFPSHPITGTGACAGTRDCYNL